MAQCVFDTLNAPADKLLLSQLIKLGGHSVISGRYEQANSMRPLFSEYKIIVGQSNNYPDKNVAHIEEFHNVIVLIDKHENPVEVLKPLFEKEIARLNAANQPIPKSGSGKAKVTFASNEKTEELRPFIDDFWNRILGTSYETSFVSDQSLLSDWEHYLDEQNNTIPEKILKIYGIDITDIYSEPVHIVLSKVRAESKKSS
jgi:hypothetical protein